MRILQLMAMVAIITVGIKWAIREGSKPPPEEDRQLIIGYDEYGAPIVDPECDVDKTLEMWHEMSKRTRSS